MSYEEDLMRRVLENKFVWNDINYLLSNGYIGNPAHNAQWGSTAYNVYKDFYIGKDFYAKGSILRLAQLVEQ